MKVFKNCCFCISLTHGGVIVGRLALIKGVIGTAALLSCLLQIVETDVGKNSRGLLDSLCNLYALFLGLVFFSVITALMLIYGATKVRV